jgi:hypothetical protein
MEQYGSLRKYRVSAVKDPDFILFSVGTERNGGLIAKYHSYSTPNLILKIDTLQRAHR